MSLPSRHPSGLRSSSASCWKVAISRLSSAPGAYPRIALAPWPQRLQQTILMSSRLDARLRRLEAQASEGPQRQGSAALLAWGQRNGLDEERLPLAALADAELDAKITTLAGARGLSLLLRQALEEERTRRKGAQGK